MLSQNSIQLPINCPLRILTNKTIWTLFRVQVAVIKDCMSSHRSKFNSKCLYSLSKLYCLNLAICILIRSHRVIQNCPTLYWAKTHNKLLSESQMIINNRMITIQHNLTRLHRGRLITICSSHITGIRFHLREKLIRIMLMYFCLQIATVILNLNKILINIKVLYSQSSTFRKIKTTYKIAFLSKNCKVTSPKALNRAWIRWEPVLYNLDKSHG
jgi:hypothetical protein